MDASILLRRKKITTGHRRREGLGRERGERERGGRIRYIGRGRREVDGHKIEKKYVAVRGMGVTGGITRKFQMPEKPESPRTQWADIS